MHRKLKKTPEAVVIAVTGRCNLSCKYCFYADEMAASNDLPTGIWLNFFEECRDAGVMRITLSGGEVFTRQDLWELIEGIVKNKMRFSILTNGTLINENTASHLNLHRRRLDFVQVSVDGSVPETHDAIRGKGSFNRMIQGIEALKKYKLPWTVRVTINKLNVFDLEATLKLLYNDLGLKSFGVNEAFPQGAGHCNHSTLEMTPEERRHSFKVVQDFDRNHPGAAHGAQAGPLIIANLIDSIDNARKRGTFDVNYRTGYLTGCNIMWEKLSVLHDGTYIPCHQLPQIKLGKVGQNSLREVWQKSPGLQQLRERSSIPLESISHCKGCKYQQYCNGGCPGVAYALTGEVNTINPRDCYRAYKGEDPVYAY
jgi:SynChlorMet cassette radical SAM/SPASM protein ScmE